MSNGNGNRRGNTGNLDENAKKGGWECGEQGVEMRGIRVRILGIGVGMRGIEMGKTGNRIEIEKINENL